MKRFITFLIVAILVTMNSSLVNAIAAESKSVSNDNKMTVSQSVYESVYGASTARKYLIVLKKDSKLDRFIDTNELKQKRPKKLDKANMVSVELEPNEVNKIKKDKDVAFIEENAPVKVASSETSVTSSTQQTIPWGIHSIGADLSLNQQGNTKIKVAELDTGIANHSDLNIAGGISFVDGVSSYSDDNGHGTHVAGTISALNNDNGIVGAAPNADVYAVKVLDQSGTGYYDQLIQGIQWAIDNKMNIISLSLGGTQISQALHQIIQEAVQQGILVIAAVGNQGSGSETELYPALFPEVVSVGAVNKSHQRSAFSSTGSELDLVAPGEGILSTTKDGAYGIMSGTSMAAPHVTGAAAALWSRGSNRTAEEIKQMLLETATPLGDGHDYGHGLVNLAKALGLTDKPIPPEDTSPIPGEVLPPTDFDIKQVDEQLLSYSNKLLDLKSKAQEAGNTTLAKSIEQTYYDLISKNQEIHRVPEDLDRPVKDEVGRLLAEQQKNTYLATNSNEFEKLRSTYESSLADFNSQLPIEDSASLVVQSDSYEPNNDPSFAMNVNLGYPYTSYISYSGDIDYYSFSPDKTGTMTIQPKCLQIKITIFMSPINREQSLPMGTLVVLEQQRVLFSL